MAKTERLKGTDAHTVYKLIDGTVVPGVTTITKRLPKPYLYGWANRLGLEGIDYEKYMEITSEIGTASHEIIEAYLTKKDPDFSMVRPEHLPYANSAKRRFIEWWHQLNVSHKVSIIFVEEKMVSRTYKYGGTLDLLLFVDGQTWLIDMKTGAKVYDDYGCQLSALGQLVSEHRPDLGKPDKYFILRLGRDDQEGSEFKEFGQTEINLWFERFLCMLDDYYIEKNLEEPAFRRN